MKFEIGVDSSLAKAICRGGGRTYSATSEWRRDNASCIGRGLLIVATAIAEGGDEGPTHPTQNEEAHYHELDQLETVSLAPVTAGAS